MTREEVFIWCRKQYGTEPDYPWADPNAVLRHKDTRKWYGLVMEVARDKLGLPGDGAIRVLNVKCESLLIGSLREKPGFLPAYHMNKENWITILLDGSVPAEEVESLLDMSYRMTGKNPVAEKVIFHAGKRTTA